MNYFPHNADDCDRALIQRANALLRSEFPEGVTRDDLRRINREQGVDFATAFLYSHFMSKRGGDWLRSDVAAMPIEESSPDTLPPSIAIAPGAFYKEYPNIGADGREFAEEAESRNWNCELIPTASIGTLDENAATIIQWFDAHGASDVVLLSFSKGAADIKIALEKRPDLWGRIRAWISVSGILYGTSITNWLLERKRLWLTKKFLLWYRNLPMESLVELRHDGDLRGRFATAKRSHDGTNSRLSFHCARDEGHSFRDDPSNQDPIHIVGFPLTKHLSCWRSRMWHRRFRSDGPNDGVMLLEDLLEQPGTVVPMWGVDHYMRSLLDNPQLLARIIDSVAIRENTAGGTPSKRTASSSERKRCRIALISPKGPLYRHRGGIFGKSLRYMPLTFPTLAALVPPELDVEVVCIDEGIDDLDLEMDADLIGMTVITGTAPRAYELADHFRKRGKTVVLGGPHVTLVPDDAQPHADSIVVGYAEEEWPRLIRDFVAGRLQRRYTQSPDFHLAGFPLPDRSVLPRSRYITSDVFEATRGCVHDCSFCVVPSAWGRKPLQKSVEEVVEDIRRQRARRAIFVDLNLIANKHYAARLFEALIPLKIQWYGLATTLLCDDLPLLDLVARSGCRGLLMGLESISVANLSDTHKRFNDPDKYVQVVERLHARKIALQGCFVFGLDDDTPDIFLKTAKFAVEAKIDLPRFAIVTPFPGTVLNKQLEQEGRILTRDWELYDGQHVVFQPAQMSVEELQRGNELAWKHVYSMANIGRRLRHTAAPWYVAMLTNFGYRYYAHRLHKFYTCDWMLNPTWQRNRSLPKNTIETTSDPSTLERIS